MRDILLLLGLCMPVASVAQTLSFDFPSLTEKEIAVVYFHGSDADSLFLSLDKQGKGSVALPSGYKGMAEVSVEGAGKLECIAASGSTRLACRDPYLTQTNVSMEGSDENRFLATMFQQKNSLLQRLGWVNTGMRLYGEAHPLHRALKAESDAVHRQNELFDQEVAASPLYAARLLQWMEYGSDLSTAGQASGERLRELKERIGEINSWEVLYTSGRMWPALMRDYALLYTRPGDEASQKEYAGAMIGILARLQEPIRSAFFNSALFQCANQNWMEAETALYDHVLENDLLKDTPDPNLKRIYARYTLKEGVRAPALKMPDGKEEFLRNTLLVFHESGCHKCVLQMKRLVERYPDLKKKGIRVISVSSDKEEAVFNYHTAGYPWNDKFCDYLPGDGENIMRFGVLSTPTVFYIDSNGIIGKRGAVVEN